MGNLRNVFVAEKRIYDDPEHPAGSPYDVALPITSTTAVLNPETGEKLSTTLANHATGISQVLTAAENAAIAAQNAQKAADGALEQLTKIANTLGAVPSQNGSLTYNGSSQSPQWNNYDSTKMTLGGVTSGVNAGTYTATFTPKSGYVWADGKSNAVSVQWTIGRQAIATVPSQSAALTYSGSEQAPTWSNYDTAKMTVGGTVKGTNAGSYNAQFTPTANYKWSDGTTTAKSVVWSIGRAAITSDPAQNGALTYTGSEQSPTWSNYDSAKLTIGGTKSSTNAGTFTATFTPTSNYCWSNGSTNAKNITWTMAKAAGSLSLSPASVTLNTSNLTKTVTVTRAGNGAITARSSNTKVATVSVSGTTLTITHVNQTSGSANITVSVAEGTNHTAPADKVCKVTASYLPAKATLNSMSWADINTICQAGKAAEYWSVGDTKNVTLTTGEEITVRIEDFNHDALASGGKAPVTFGMVDCLNTTRNMNSSNTNSGGWGSSARRSYMSTLLDQFPSDLKGVIKSVTKTTSAGNNSSSLTTTNDKLWLFSYTEVNFDANTSYSPGGEGTAYPLFVSNTSRVKKVNGSAGCWWLRSPCAAYTVAFCFVNGYGTAAHSRASSRYGVAVGFCL